MGSSKTFPPTHDQLDDASDTLSSDLNNPLNTNGEVSKLSGGDSPVEEEALNLGSREAVFAHATA